MYWEFDCASVCTQLYKQQDRVHRLMAAGVVQPRMRMRRTAAAACGSTWRPSSWIGSGGEGDATRTRGSFPAKTVKMEMVGVIIRGYWTDGKTK